jgi:hypothetical protein
LTSKTFQSNNEDIRLSLSEDDKKDSIIFNASDVNQIFFNI